MGQMGWISGVGINFIEEELYLAQQWDLTRRAARESNERVPLGSVPRHDERKKKRNYESDMLAIVITRPNSTNALFNYNHYGRVKGMEFVNHSCLSSSTA